MNPRIRELVEEAGLDAILDQHAHEYGNGMLANTSYPEVAKFAELIIAECCVALRPMLRDMISRSRGVDLIVEHFGVES